MYWNRITSVDNLCGMLAFCLVMSIGIIGNTLEHNSKQKASSSVYTPKQYSKDTNNILSGNVHLGNISYEELLGNLPEHHRYELQVITQAEDEYWEIEKVGSTYYRVRREDYYPREELIEFDIEDKIGNIDELYNYAKSRGLLHSY